MLFSSDTLFQMYLCVLEIKYYANWTARCFFNCNATTYETHKRMPVTLSYTLSNHLNNNYFIIYM